MIFLIIKRVENLHGIESSHSLYPNEIYRTIESDYAPVRCFVCHDGAEIIFSVDKLNTGFDIILMVNSNHHAGLIEADLVVAGNLYLGLKLAAIFGIVEGSIVDREAIVGYAPVVAFGCYRHGEAVVVDVPV